MKIKFNFGFWDVVQFVFSLFIAMQVGALVGRIVIDTLLDSGAPPLAILITAILAIFASVVMTDKALFRIDKWFDAWLESKRGRKYRLQFLNLPRAWSIWIMDKSTPNRVLLSDLEHHGVFGLGFYRIEPGDGLFRAYRNKRYTSYRFWRFSVEFGKR